MILTENEPIKGRLIEGGLFNSFVPWFSCNMEKHADIVVGGFYKLI